MSDQEEQSPSEQNEEEEQEENQEQNQEDEEQEDVQGSNEDQDSNQQEQQSQQEEQQAQDESKNEDEQEKKIESLPKFRSIEPEEFKFTSLLAQISSLSVNVDRFIETLPSQGGFGYRSYLPPHKIYAPPPLTPFSKPQQQKLVIMKDEDVQVSMQPQIVIQPTKVEKPQMQPKYKISSQNNKFLAQLYQQNKKLKRWQNSSHNANSHAGASSVGSAFYGSRERFQRQNYQKGLFNVQERNKEIDEAIQKLKSDLQ